MNILDFFATLVWMNSQDSSRRWPYHVTPGSYDGGEIGVVEDEGSPFVPTEDNWIAIGYNPPQHCARSFPDVDPDLTVRPKPTWAEIELGDAARRLSERQANVATENIVERDKIYMPEQDHRCLRSG